jgi:UbiD family decarboxylase
MDLREFLAELEAMEMLRHEPEPTSPRLEVASRIFRYDGQPICFDSLRGYPGWRCVSGIMARRDIVARALVDNGEVKDLIHRITRAMANPQTPPKIATAPCQEVIAPNVDLHALPIPRYHPRDGGPYITAGVTVVHDPDYGRNICFHRWMLRDARHFTGRIVEGRGTDTAWRKTSTGAGLPIAVCIGLPPHILLAAALSPPKGMDELRIAQALAPTPVTSCRTVPLEIPAMAELVLEGILTHELGPEGPFPDLTGTMDHVRQQPVFRVTAITHRRAPIFHALLPAGLEHKNLMGMPREPTIYAEVNKVVKCTGVYITPGGCSWLHAVVQIEKQGVEDGRLAIEAAFKGHTSLKHVVVVDTDVNLYNPQDVAWAIATRFQADRGLYVFPDQPSSSLDPSARQIPGQKARTAKMGLDATIPWGASKEGYLRVSY